MPSDNTTMESAILAMLRARESVAHDRFTFHFSRIRVNTVTRDEPAKMDGDSSRCSMELFDAHVEVLG